MVADDVGGHGWLYYDKNVDPYVISQHHRAGHKAQMKWTAAHDVATSRSMQEIAQPVL